MAALRHSVLSVYDECGDLTCVMVSSRGVKWLNWHNLEDMMYFISVVLGRIELFTMDHGVFSLRLAFLFRTTSVGVLHNAKKATAGAMPEIQQTG